MTHVKTIRNRNARTNLIKFTGKEPTLSDADSKESAVIVQNTATISAANSPV
jgi:hypothetical protein